MLIANNNQLKVVGRFDYGDAQQWLLVKPKSPVIAAPEPQSSALLRMIYLLLGRGFPVVALSITDTPG